MNIVLNLIFVPMESTATNQTPSPSSTVDDDNGDGVYTDEFTKLPPDSPHSSEDEDSVDFSHEQGLRTICTFG